MFDPRPLYCSSLTTAVGGTWETNIVDSAHLPWHESMARVEAERDTAYHNELMAHMDADVAAKARARVKSELSRV